MKMRENLFWLKKFSDGPTSFWIGFFLNLKPPSFPFCFFFDLFYNFFCLFFCFCFGEYVDMDSLSVSVHIHMSLVWNQIVKQDFDVQRRVRVTGFDLGNTSLQWFVRTLFLFASFVCLHDSNQSKIQKIFLGFKFCLCLLFVAFKFWWWFKMNSYFMIYLSFWAFYLVDKKWWGCTLSSPYSISGLSAKDTNKFMNLHQDPRRGKRLRRHRLETQKSI